MRQKIWSARELADMGEVAAPQGGGEGNPTTRTPAAGATRESGVAGLAAGGEGSGGGGGSDVRLKEDIEQIGRTKHDLPLYRFRYKGGSEAYTGVMAQDVLGVMPEAVSVGPDGFYRVNYDMLGITMVRVN